MNLLVQAFLWIVGTFAVLGLLLFIPAGTTAWTAGWVYLIILLAYSVITIAVLYATNRDLLRDRLSLSQPNQDPRDRVLTDPGGTRASSDQHRAP